MSDAVALAEPVLEVEDLVVRYGDATAVDRASFTVSRGDVFGFIGPNGAGKSSTMRVLATLMPPASGKARVLGRDVVDDAEWIRWRLGYMPDLFGMPEALTVGEYLRFQADVFALPASSVRAAIDTSLELTDLTDQRGKLVGALSKGNRQRLFLARTLLPEPEVLILDEPASGLDPRARIELRALLSELRAMGKTILISSHVLTELQEICNAVGIIEAGRVLAAGPVDEILARLKPHVSVVAEVVGGAQAAVNDLAGRELVTAVAHEGDELRFDFHGDRLQLAALLAGLVTSGHRLCSFRVDRGDMEDVFLSVTLGQVT